MMLRCGAYSLDLTSPKVMGIVNLTPDSFSGDGLAGNVSQAIAHARRLLEEGADLLDLGAESTRPGAMPVELDEERQRLLPVLEEVRSWGVPISIDTYKPELMAEALAMGASMINDINGLRDAAAVDVVAKSNCAICIMHMQGAPLNMQQAPGYVDVLTEVAGFLEKQVKRCVDRGIDENRIVLDPGFGFGKRLEDNYRLLAHLERCSLGRFPVLAGVSRKSMIGMVTGRDAGAARMPGSVAAAVLAAERGAGIVRVHDVAATRDALAVWAAVKKGEEIGA